MNIQFLIGLGAGFLCFTEQGKGLMQSVVSATDKIAGEALKIGKDTLKEALPATAQLFGVKDDAELPPEQ